MAAQKKSSQKKFVEEDDKQEHHEELSCGPTRRAEKGRNLRIEEQLDSQDDNFRKTFDPKQLTAKQLNKIFTDHEKLCHDRGKTGATRQFIS